MPNGEFIPLDKSKPAKVSGFIPLDETPIMPINITEQQKEQRKLVGIADQKIIEREAKLSAIDNLGFIEGYNQDEKNYLKTLAKNPSFTPAELDDAIKTVGGNHVKQDGDQRYYMDYNSKGMLVPIPLGNNERPPKGKQIESVWGSQLSAEDDSLITTIGKNLAATLPELIESYGAIGATIQGLFTGSDAEWYTNMKNRMEAIVPKTKLASEKGFVNLNKQEAYNGIFNADNWEFTPDNLAGNISNGLSFVAQFLAGGAIAKAAGVGAKAIGAVAGAKQVGTVAALGTGTKMAAKSPYFVGSYMTNLGEALEAAEEAGVEGRDKYAIASLVTIPIAMLDIGFGLEAKIISDPVLQGEKNAMIKQLIKGWKDTGGVATKEGLDQLYKTTTVSAIETFQRMASSGVETGFKEGGQEVAQEIIQRGSQKVYDNLFAEGQIGAGKYGTEITSPESLTAYINNFIGGAMLGAAGGVVVDRMKSQSTNAYDAVKQGPESVLAMKAELGTALKTKRISQDDYDLAVMKIDHFNDFFQKTSDTNLDDESRRRVFDLTWHNGNIENQIEALTKRKNGGPGDVLLEQQIGEKQGLKDSNSKEVFALLRGGDHKQQTTLSEQDKIDLTEEEVPKPTDEMSGEEQEFIIKNVKKVKAEMEKGEEKVEPETVLAELRKRYKKEKGVVEAPVEESVGSVKQEGFAKQQQEQTEEFSSFVENAIPAKKFNFLDHGIKAKVLINFLKQKGQKRIQGTIQEAEKSFKVYKNKKGAVITGFHYDVEIGDKRFKFASKEHTRFIKEYDLVDKPVNVKLVEPSNSDIAEVVREHNAREFKETGKKNDLSVIRKEDGSSGFKYKSSEVIYPFILQVRAAKNDVFIGNLAIRGGKEYQLEKEERQALEGRPTSLRPKKIIVIGKSTYNIDLKDGELVVTDKSGIEIIGKEKQAIIRRYEREYDYDNGNYIETIPEGITEVELPDYIAENSNNPMEVIDIYQDTKGKVAVKEGDYKESIISDVLGSVSRKSFIDVDDKNNITPALAKTYFSDKDAPSLNQVADEATEMAGTLITEQDIADFMKKYPREGDYAKALRKVEPSSLEALRGRFRVLTGMELTPRIIEIAQEQKGEEAVSEVGEPVPEVEEEEMPMPDFETQAQQAEQIIPEEGDIDELLPQRRKLEEYFTETAKQRQEKINLLKKAIPKADVIMDDSIKDADGNSIAGQLDTDGKTIRLNPSYYYADVPIHEFGHALIDMTGGTANKFNKRGIDQLRGTKLWKDVASKYTELSEDMLAKEVLATAIGREGALLYESKKTQSGFRQWLTTFLNKIKRLLGIESNVARNLANQLLSGEEISLGRAVKSDVVQQAKLTPKGEDFYAQYQVAYNKRTNWEKIRDVATEAINLPRALITTLDMSAPLRQGVILTVTKPKLAGAAFKAMFKFAFSKKEFDKWMSNLKASDEYIRMNAVKLYIADPDAHLAKKEEAFMTNLVKKIPLYGKLVAGAERAYIGYLNKIRVDAFLSGEKMYLDMGFTYENNPEIFKAHASFINNASGRGGMGALEDSAQVLNTVFFSPRLIASRFNMLNPSWYAKQPVAVRKESLKAFGKFIGVGSTILLLAAAAGAKVEEDPRSTDFGKIRIGNIRWDVWGGFQQWVRLYSQLITGQKKTIKGKVLDLSKAKYPHETRLDVAVKFFRGKLAPIPGLALELMDGQKLVGGEITAKDELINKTIPLYLQDLGETINESGPEEILGTAVPSFFGVGVQNYGKKKK